MSDLQIFAIIIVASILTLIIDVSVYTWAERRRQAVEREQLKREGRESDG